MIIYQINEEGRNGEINALIIKQAIKEGIPSAARDLLAFYQGRRETACFHREDGVIEMLANQWKSTKIV